AGWCRPLDPQDLAERAWIPHSGWPLDRNTLDPFYARARVLCDLTDGPFDVESLQADPTAQVTSIAETDVLTTAVYRLSPGPRHFGEHFRPELEAAPNVRVHLGANVVAIVTNGGTVDHYQVATLDGNRYRVKARAFVVAMGGIENARV